MTEENRPAEATTAYPGSEDENPALIDAHRMFVFTFVGAIAFIGVVVTFIL